MTDQRTLDELDPPAWGPPTYDSYLVRRCHELRRKPLEEFTIEDLRIMIGQQIALPHVVPLALDVLRTNPLAEGDFYPGDLLHSVLSVDGEYWRAHRDEWRAASKIIKTLNSAPDELRGVIERFGKGGP